MDLHALLQLVERGCPPVLAARILAPADGEGAAAVTGRAWCEVVPQRGSSAGAGRLVPAASTTPRPGCRRCGPPARSASSPWPGCTRCCCGPPGSRPVAGAPAVAAAGAELDDLAVQAADDAMLAVLPGWTPSAARSRFTTWAYKFAVYEMSVKVRRRAWQHREVPLGPQSWALVPDVGALPQQHVEGAELRAAIRGGIAGADAAPARRPASPWPSTTCPSTSSPNGSAPPGAPSTRPCTTPAAGCARTSPSAVC